MQQTGERSSEGKTAVSIERTEGAATLELVLDEELEEVVELEEEVTGADEDEVTAVDWIELVEGTELVVVATIDDVELDILDEDVLVVVEAEGLLAK